MDNAVLIAGCGDLGTAVGLALASGGRTVIGLRRRAEPLPAPLHTLQADLTRPSALAGLPDGIGLVYYIATPDRFDDGAYRQAYVVGCATCSMRWRGNDRRRGGWCWHPAPPSTVSSTANGWTKTRPPSPTAFPAGACWNPSSWH